MSSDCSSYGLSLDTLRQPEDMPLCPLAARVRGSAVGKLNSLFSCCRAPLKLSVEGADVQITKAVLGWDNRRDETITDIGVLKAGGSTTPKDAPGRKGRLKSVTVTYKIVGEAPTAVLKVWGYD